MPGGTQQQQRRETKLKKVRKEKKRQSEWYSQERATAGSLWPQCARERDEGNGANERTRGGCERNYEKGSSIRGRIN